MFVTQPKVFISSTIVDLPNERKAAYNAVTRTGAFPVMSEITIEAQNADSLTTCLNKVKESDIYVLILGGRYGWQPDGKESITELEFQTAMNCKIPILVFNTTYPKDELQKQFERKVEESRFRKTVNDAYELETEIEKSLKVEIEKKQNALFSKTEPVYSNLVKIKFPQNVYYAELNIDKKRIIKFNEERGYSYHRKPSLYDYAVSALYMKGISFSHDWVLDGKYILTFHDLQDPNVELTQIIDPGTVEHLNSEEFYSISEDKLAVFKHLLRACLDTKLYKLGIRWIKDEQLFAFIPNQKDDKGRWKSRKAQWHKTNRNATRSVVDIKWDIKDKEKIYNLKCLAFRSNFEYLNDEWFVSIKPDWVFLWNDLSVCSFAFKNIQWLKRNERNMHVFNHFNFILKYLQPKGPSLFLEFCDYPFLSMGHIEKFDFAPIVPDDIWISLEEQGGAKKLIDEKGKIDLFEL